MSGSGDEHSDAVHEAIQQHAPIGREALLTGWALVAEWVDHDGERWITKAHAASTSNWAAKGMHHEALFGKWPDGALAVQGGQTNETEKESGMGHWSMHIEGAGIHDNGRDDDAEVMLKEFAAKLAEHHSVHAVTFTVGSTRELVTKAEHDAGEAAAESLSPAERTRVLAPGEHEWRHRYH